MSISNQTYGMYQIWFRLYNSYSGLPYMGTSVTSVSLPPSAVIDQLRKAVKAEYSDSHLKGVAPSDLKIEFYEPLKEDSHVKGLGKSIEDALIVAVPSLKERHIDRPNPDVILRIQKSFNKELANVLGSGEDTACIELYNTVKQSPTSVTRGIIQNDMNIIINGPLSAQNRNILIAIDFKSTRVILIKLLRLPEFYSSKATGHDQLIEAINTEVQTCQKLSEQNIVGLVACTATLVE